VGLEFWTGGAVPVAGLSGGLVWDRRGRGGSAYRAASPSPLSDGEVVAALRRWSDQLGFWR
jgi:hypothetical protein